MQLTKIMGAAVTSLVIILVVVSVLVPILQESDNTTYVDSQNQGQVYKMDKADSTYDARLTLVSFAESEPYKSTWTLGAAGTTTGDTIELSGDDTMLWYSDKSIVYITATTGYVWNLNTNENGAAFHTGASPITYVEWSQGTMTAKTENGGRTSSYTWVMAPDDTGDWGFFDGTVNVSNASKIYVPSISNNKGTVGFGTVGDIDPLVYNANVTATYTATYTEHEYYNTVTATASTYGETSITPIGVVAPMEYVSGTDGTTSMVDTLLGLTPLLIIVGLIVSLVGLVVTRRDY